MFSEVKKQCTNKMKISTDRKYLKVPNRNYADEEKIIKFKNSLEELATD